MPLQSDFNFGAGSKDKMVYILNVQPVIPIKIADDWNLITCVVTYQKARKIDFDG